LRLWDLPRQLAQWGQQRRVNQQDQESQLPQWDQNLLALYHQSGRLALQIQLRQ
jgi:hypothetical protein